MNTTTNMSTQAPITKQMIIDVFEEEMERQYHDVIFAITNTAADCNWFYECGELTQRMTKLLEDDGFQVVHTENEDGEFDCTVYGWSDFKYEHGRDNNYGWNIEAPAPTTEPMKNIRNIYVMACTELANSMKYHAFATAADGHNECVYDAETYDFQRVNSVPSRIHMCLAEAGIELWNNPDSEGGLIGYGWDNR